MPDLTYRRRQAGRGRQLCHADIDWPSDAGPLPAQEMDGPHRSSCPHVVAPVVEPFDQVQQWAVAQVGCSTVVEFGAGLESLVSLTDQDHHPVWDDDEVHRPAEVCAPPQLLPWITCQVPPETRQAARLQSQSTEAVSDILAPNPNPNL